MSRSSPQQDSSGSGDEDWAPHSHSGSPDGTCPQGVRRCKVDGCALDLTHHKTFFRRARCCPEHARELTVHLGGEAKRLCQQCSAFHLLADFDGTKRSCRTRLESHKIRQREHNNRRMAQAAAALQRKAAAETGAASASPRPAAAPGVQLPDTSGGQTLKSMAYNLGQQMPLGGTQLGHSAPRALLQQPAPWQQAQQASDLLAAQQQQQQEQRLQQIAAGMCDASSIFADVPLDKMPLDLQPDRQSSGRRSPVDVYNLSNFWEGPPPQGCQAFNAHATAGGTPAPSIGEMDLAQPLPLIELYGSSGITPRSVRSMSADAGAARFEGWAGSSLREAASSRPGSSGSHKSRSSCHSSASRLMFRDSDPLDIVLRSDSAFEEDRPSPFAKSPFQLPAKTMSPGSRTQLKRNASREVPEGASLRTRSVKRASLNSYDSPSRETFCTAKRASLSFLRTDSATEGGADLWRLALAASAGRQEETLYRRSSLDGCCSGASSPSRSLQSSESTPARSLVRRHTIGRCSVPLPRSVKRRSLSVLPDAATPEVGDHMSDRAFVEQAPEPLYLAAQLAKEMGLQQPQLPEFSYGCSHSTSSSPGLPLHHTDAVLPLRGCVSDSGELDEIGSAALKALLETEGTSALDDVSERLQLLACSIARSQKATQPLAMARRIRRRSCDEAAMRRGLLSLVA